MSTFILLNKSILNRVKIIWYAMVWCAMVCHDEWESVRLYAFVWYSNDIVWDSMLCYEISILCYAMLYVVRSVWSDCTFFSKTITFLNKYHLHKIKVLTWDGDSRATSMTSLRIYYFCFLECSDTRFYKCTT